MNDKFKFYPNLHVQHYFEVLPPLKIHILQEINTGISITNSPPEFKYWNSHMEGQQEMSIYKYFASHWFLESRNLRVVTHGVWASFIFSFLTNLGAFSSLHINVDRLTWFNWYLLKFIHKVYSVEMKTTTNNQPGKRSTGTTAYINYRIGVKYCSNHPQQRSHQWRICYTGNIHSLVKPSLIQNSLCFPALISLFAGDKENSGLSWERIFVQQIQKKGTISLRGARV